MGLRTMIGTLDGGEAAAVLYCSTLKRSLPIIFESGEEADAFVECFGDIRHLKYEDQVKMFDEWREWNDGTDRAVKAIRAMKLFATVKGDADLISQCTEALDGDHVAMCVCWDKYRRLTCCGERIVDGAILESGGPAPHDGWDSYEPNTYGGT